MCCRSIGSIALLMFVFGCSLSDDSPAISVFTSSFDFSQSQDDWIGDFTGLPSNDFDSTLYELKFEYTDLPSSLGARKSIMMSGNNHSHDLFMFMKRKISGLIPNTAYNLVFEVELASNTREGSVGAGGSPGSIYLKAGASDIEPIKVIYYNQFVLNIDKGLQNKSGSNAITLGDISIPSSAPDYVLITRSNASSSSGQPFIAHTNSDGELWLFIGTDSGFEGTTTVFYTKVNIVFSTAD